MCGYLKMYQKIYFIKTITEKRKSAFYGKYKKELKHYAQLQNITMQKRDKYTLKL